MANEFAKKVVDEVDLDELEDVEFLEYEEYFYKGEGYFAPYNWDRYLH